MTAAAPHGIRTAACLSWCSPSPGVSPLPPLVCALLLVVSGGGCSHQKRRTGFSFLMDDWANLITLQTMDGLSVDKVLSYRQFDRPIVLDEDRYETYHAPLKKRTSWFRNFMWTTLVLGMHPTYGGVRCATLPPHHSRNTHTSRNPHAHADAHCGLPEWGTAQTATRNHAAAHTHIHMHSCS